MDGAPRYAIVEVRERTRWLLLQPSIQFEPIGESVDPVIGGETLLPHSEAVAAFLVHVQFCRLVSLRPLCVEGDARGRESEVIVGSGRNKHRRCIGGNRSIFLHSAPIDRGDECGPAFRRVMKGNSDSYRSSCGESDNADAIRRNAPFRCVLTNIGDGR